ncbi:MAG TPA: hypothetical protein DEQ44_04680, partial [Flavobacteriaceae bacterium]|nr:hypothetical protein [Flavobacteriaceae bacterium]
FDRWNPQPIRLKKKIKKTVLIIGFSLFGLGQISAQEPISQADWVQRVLDHQPQLKAAQQAAKSVEAFKGTGWDLGSTEVYHQFDQNNIAPNGQPLRVWGVNQTIPFPTVMASRQRLLSQKATAASLELQSILWSWERKAIGAYRELMYRQQVVGHWKKLADQLNEWTQKNERKLALGGITVLAYKTALAKSRSVQQQLNQE